MDQKINRIYLSVFWLLLTVSLGIWWFFLGLRQAEMISELTHSLGEPYATMGQIVWERQSRMIWMEGTFFIILLTFGGSLLIWFSYRDVQRNNLIQDFFSTVTHEMKTPVAGLRLQVEALMEDLGENTKHNTSLKRAIKESDRIESQMEKAFYLASIMRSESLFIENVDPIEIQRVLQDIFPEVQWNIEVDQKIRADKRALESILINLIENSYKHGYASKVNINISTLTDFIILLVEDNGTGFHGNMNLLGKPFVKQSSTSGTGIGIYICKGLVAKMNGKIDFYSDEKGFKAKLTLPRAERLSG